MQDRYVGDIGDYVKLSLLRVLMPGRTLGMAWWRVPDETHNADGKHLTYLDRPTMWQGYDRTVFDALAHIVRSGNRSVTAIETSGLLPGARHASDILRLRDVPPGARAAHRAAWFAGVQAAVADCDLVFVDPDNGLEPVRFRPSSHSSGKCVMFDELIQLQKPGRTLIAYHHQTRHKGGNLSELAHLAERIREKTRLEPAGALRARRGTPRAFFLLDASTADVQRAQLFADRWVGHCEWVPLASDSK